MKRLKLVLIGIVILVGMLLLTGCGNRDMLDTNYTFNRAIVILNDGTKLELEIKKWADYEDGEQIQIIAKDGKTYLVSSYNTILIKD